jgi:hypothetical protein
MSDVSTAARRTLRRGQALLAAGGLACIAALPALRHAQARLGDEIDTLRASAAVARYATDSLTAVANAEQERLRLEHARAGARAIASLHLVIAADSGTVALMRDGLVLRAMPAQFSGAKPTPGTHEIARITTAALTAAPVTVDSLGNAVAAPPTDPLVARAELSDGTVLEGGDAAAVFRGGIAPGDGPRRIIVSRRDFAAIRPNLVKGMPVVVF